LIGISGDKEWKRQVAIDLLKFVNAGLIINKQFIKSKILVE
jgi:hypothetical protein